MSCTRSHTRKTIIADPQKLNPVLGATASRPTTLVHDHGPVPTGQAQDMVSPTPSVGKELRHPMLRSYPRKIAGLGRRGATHPAIQNTGVAGSHGPANLKASSRPADGGTSQALRGSPQERAAPSSSSGPPI